MNDLPVYLRRIGLAKVPAPCVDSLFALHRAHAESIPFENLDILLGRPIRLDLPSLEAKLVAARRGGYCFEQNALFAAALTAIGFTLTPLAARVRLGDRRDSARAHMLLSVRAGDRNWLADVGFGGGGLLEPMAIEPSGEARQGDWRFRVVADGPERVLQNWGPAGWRDLYAFTLEPQLPIDFVVANHYTSTHPDSSFTKMAVVQRTSADVAYMIRGDLFSTMRPGAPPEERPIARVTRGCSSCSRSGSVSRFRPEPDSGRAAPERRLPRDVALGSRRSLRGGQACRRSRVTTPAPGPSPQ